MKKVKFTATLPEDVYGVLEYDDEEYQDAEDSGEIYYHGKEFLMIDEILEIKWEVIED